MKKKLTLPLAALLGIGAVSASCDKKIEPKELTMVEIMEVTREEARKLAVLVRQHPDAVGVQEKPPYYLSSEEAEKMKARASHIRFRMFPPEKVDGNGDPIVTCKVVPCCLADRSIPPGHTQCSSPCTDSQGNPEMDCRVENPVPTVMRTHSLHSLGESGHESYQMFLPPKKGSKSTPPEYRLFLVNAALPAGKTCEVELIERKQPSNDYTDKLNIHCSSSESASGDHIFIIGDHGINGIQNRGGDFIHGESIPKPEDIRETRINTEAEHIDRVGSRSTTDIIINYEEAVFNEGQLQQINKHYAQLSRDIRAAIEQKIGKCKKWWTNLF